MEVRVPKVAQPRDGVPVHEVPRGAHDVALERHGEPDPGAQPRGPGHVAPVDEVGEVAALHAAGPVAATVDTDAGMDAPLGCCGAAAPPSRVTGAIAV